VVDDRPVVSVFCAWSEAQMWTTSLAGHTAVLGQAAA